MDWKNALSVLRTEMPEEDNEKSNTSSEEIVSERTDKKKETLHIVIERKGRKGKTATIIEGFLCDDEELESIARNLKQKIGTGGSARGGEILLQGEWRERAAEFLRNEGYKVKG